MTPKEKAQELVDKYYPRATSYSLDRKNQKDNAKQCALTAVDELIKQVNHSDVGYWQEVKQEIEKP